MLVNRRPSAVSATVATTLQRARAVVVAVVLPRVTSISTRANIGRPPMAPNRLSRKRAMHLCADHRVPARHHVRQHVVWHRQSRDLGAKLDAICGKTKSEDDRREAPSSLLWGDVDHRRPLAEPLWSAIGGLAAKDAGEEG